MGTPDNPTVFIQFYDEDYTMWRELITRCKSFTVKDAGVLKIPQATVFLREPPVLPTKGNRLRIQVDTLGGAGKLIFYGKISEINTIPISATAKKHYTFIAYGLEKRLKNDTITWEYGTEQESHGDLWTYKKMIEDFLVLPDSGYDTNITLDTDTQEILNGVQRGCDFKRATLLNALRKISETIFYDGYVYIDPSDNAQLKYKKLGTLWADPPTTLEDPFIGKPELDDSIDEIRNYILPWGGVDKGYPWDGDKFSERGVAKFVGNPIWEALNGETIADTKSDPADLKNVNLTYAVTSNTLTDISKTWAPNEWKGYSVYIIEGVGAGQLRSIVSNTGNKLTIAKNWNILPYPSKYQIFLGHNIGEQDVVRKQLSRYAIDISKAAQLYKFKLNINKTGVASIDLQERYSGINFSLWVKKLRESDIYIGIRLLDVSGDAVAKGVTYAAGANWTIWGKNAPNWKTFSFSSLPLGEEIKPPSHTSEWYYSSDSTTFDATQVKTLEIYTKTLGTNMEHIFLDRLYFGGGLKIDPFENPQHYPSPAVNGAIFDLNSIGEPNNYGVRVYHHTDRDISSFAEATLEGSRILSILKQPIKTAVVVKKGLEWLRPHQNITLNSSSLGISNKIWRPMELMWKWQANYPVYCKLRLVEQYSKIAPVFTPNGEIPASTSMPTWEGWFGRDWGKPTNI